MDNAIVNVHPYGTGLQKSGPQAIGGSCGGWTTGIHLVAEDARTAAVFPPSRGQARDAPRYASRTMAGEAGRETVLIDGSGI